MRRRIFGLLSAAVALVITFIVVFQSSEREIDEVRANLFRSVEHENAAIESIDISLGEARVNLVFQDSVWRIGTGSPAAGYEVDSSMIAGLVGFIKSAKYIEKKTSQQAKLVRLGLSDFSAYRPTGKPILLAVRFRNKEEAVLIGNESQSGLGTYVRLPNTPQAWLVSGQIDIPTDLVDWIPRVFIDVERSEIVRAEFLSADGESVVISAQSEVESAMIENLPLGASLAHASVADGALDTLVNLRLAEVARTNELSWSGVARANYQLSSGETILIRCLEWKGGFWVSVERAGLLDEWAYRIDKHRYDQFTKKMSDYLATKLDKTEQAA